MQDNQETIENLKYLRLLYAAENLSEFTAANAGASAQEVIAKLVRLEVVEKKARTIGRRITEAKLGRFHKMDTFDWNWPEQINRHAIESYLNLDFMASGSNLILIGAQGLGKTMIAKNILWAAVNKGHRGLFTTASKLVTDLLYSSHKLETAIKKYTSPDILVIDELGYLSFEQKSADLLFEIVSRRYESKPIILTTNLAFSEWPTIFPGAACVTALVDRLTHGADIIKLSGKSFRTEGTKAKEKKTH